MPRNNLPKISGSKWYSCKLYLTQSASESHIQKYVLASQIPARLSNFVILWMAISNSGYWITKDSNLVLLWELLT